MMTPLLTVLLAAPASAAVSDEYTGLVTTLLEDSGLVCAQVANIIELRDASWSCELTGPAVSKRDVDICLAILDNNCTDIGDSDEDADSYTIDEGDCDDDDGAINPGAVEVCDDVDNNCDGETDNGDDATAWYFDRDGDGYGHGDAQLACSQPYRHVDNDGDCDAYLAHINPDAEEVCDGVDNDCDTTVDVDAADATIWYADDDSDGYGTSGEPLSCSDWLARGYAEDGLYTITPFGDDTALEVWCDMTEDDGGWTLLFSHDYGASGELFASDADAALRNAQDPTADLYSILDYTSAFENSDGTYELRLTWPGEGLDINHWTQTTDPTGDGVSDYTAIDVSYTGNSWGGLELSSNSNTYLDGSVDHSNWWYSVGARSLHDGGIPGPSSNVVDAVQLWVRADTSDHDALTVAACEQPDGYTADNTDCDDAADWRYPGAEEVCDGARGDCDDRSWLDDAGLASFQASDDAWTDYTGTLGAGAAGAPASTTLSSEGTLNVCEGTWYVNLSASASVAVVGHGGQDSVILDGDSAGQVLSYSNGVDDVRIEGLTLSNGSSSTYGGALYLWENETVVLRDLTVTDSDSGQFGGGVFVYGGTDVTLDGLWFEGNFATSSGGGLTTYSCDAVAATELTFIDNSSDSSGGGWNADYGYITASDLYFEGNYAADYGGGLSLGHGVDTITDSVFYDNEVDYQGGGVSLYSSEARLERVLIEGNLSPSGGGYSQINGGSLGTIVDSELTGNEASTGGGILVSGGALTVENADFSDNVDYDVYAGGDYTYGDAAYFTCDDAGCTTTE